MCNNAVLCLFFSLVINFYYSATASHWVYIRSPVQSRIANDVPESNNDTDLSQDFIESNLTSITEDETLFWTKPDTTETVEAVSETPMDSDALDKGPENVNNTTEVLEDSTEMETNDSTSEITNPQEPVQADEKTEENAVNEVTHDGMPDSIMDEKIVLDRNNCNLEIAVQETYDLKIEIKFGKLQNNTSGKCCITLNGQQNAMLGVLISNVYLYQNASQGEVLKVITADYGTDFVVKEYHSWSKYEPLLLTETHKVYLVLYYKVVTVPEDEQDSHFNLEVFSYHKYENYVNHEISYNKPHLSYTKGAQNFPTQHWASVPYFY